MNTCRLHRLDLLLAALLTAVGLIAVAAPHPACAQASGASAAAEPNDRAGSDWEDDAPDRSATHRRRGDEMVHIWQDSHLSKGEHADAVVTLFGDTRIEGSVKDSAVAVFGNTYVDGPVGGGVVAIFGRVELGPNAVVGGDVVALGGTVQRDPAAMVQGRVQTIAGRSSSLEGLTRWIDDCLLYGRPLALVSGLGWAWGIALGFLALYALIALLFHDAVIRCVAIFEEHAGATVLAALLAVLFIPVLLILLCITVIGIAAVPFIVLGMLCATVFGKAVMLCWLGRRCVGGSNGRFDPALAVVIGGIIVLALYAVPVLGFVLFQLLGFLGLGIVIYTLIDATRAWQTTSSARPAAAAGVAAAAADAAAAGGAAAGGAAAGGAAANTAADPGGATAAYAAPMPPATAALPRAGFWIRMIALLLDALLVGFLVHLLHVGHFGLLALGIYGALMWKLRGTTIGGIIFDLAVVRLDGLPIDWATAIVRAFGCFLSLAVAGLGFFWIAFGRERQAWHDKIAGTVVVQTNRRTLAV